MFNIGSRKIGADGLFFVVEEGQANLGDFKKALAMIDVCSVTGADAIEFQLAIAGDFYVKNHPGYEIYAKREFKASQIKELARRAKSRGIEMIAVPLSHRLVEPLAAAGCSAFNINASDITNPDVIDAVAESGLPFFLSIPLATQKEIDWALTRITKKGAKNYGILHGQHVMASGSGCLPLENTALGFINSLKSKLKVPVGFIDHTPHAWFPAAAVAAGADMVTKHMAISRNEKGPDCHICLEPDEMKNAVILARQLRKSEKTSIKKLAIDENKDRLIMRRSIVATRKLAIGDIISRKDLAFKRPGTGICPTRSLELIGKAVTKEISPDEQIDLTYIRRKSNGPKHKK